MQGKQEESHDLFIYKTVDDFVPQSHMLRKIEAVLNLNFVRELTQSFYSDLIRALVGFPSKVLDISPCPISGLVSTPVFDNSVP